jgi:hypothetical protein
MNLPLPIRLDRLQLGLYSTLTAALAPVRVSWAYGEQSFETVPDEGLVSLNVISGPTPTSRQHKRGTILNPIADVDLTVASLEIGAKYIVRINEFDYSTEAGALDTVTTIRDRLTSEIDADTLEDVTTSDVGIDAFTLTAGSSGAIRSIQLFGPLTAGAPTIDPQSVLITEGGQEMLINLEAFSKGREPRTGALTLTSISMAVLQSEDYVETLRSYGIAIRSKGPTSNLSALAGGHWESRASFDFVAAMSATWVRPIDRIETVHATIQTGSISTSFTVTA